MSGSVSKKSHSGLFTIIAKNTITRNAIRRLLCGIFLFRELFMLNISFCFLLNFFKCFFFRAPSFLHPFFLCTDTPHPLPPLSLFLNVRYFPPPRYRSKILAIFGANKCPLVAARGCFGRNHSKKHREHWLVRDMGR